MISVAIFKDVNEQRCINVMSVNRDRNLRGANTGTKMEGVANIKTGKQAVGEEGIMTSAGENNPVLITRRLNIKIQGSMSDFAQVRTCPPLRSFVL